MTEITPEHLVKLTEELENYISPNNMFGFKKEFKAWVTELWSTALFYDTDVVDSGFDVSLYPTRTSLTLREVATTYCDFLNSNTGQSIATYVSGCGITCESYSDKLDEFYGDKCHDFINRFIKVNNLVIPNSPEFKDFDDILGILAEDAIEGGEDLYCRFGHSGCELEPYTCGMIDIDKYDENIFGNWLLQDFYNPAK